MNKSFTEKELATLAEMVCGRVDMLRGIVDERRATNEAKLAAKDAIFDLTTLDAKLRPHYSK